jgi:hypothetical protein
MTSHAARLYVTSLSIVVFFLAWVVVAAKPWATAAPDPRLAALAAREAQLRAESTAAQRLVNDRWATYRRELARIRAERGVQSAPPANVAPPPVRVVTLPPVTVTRSS